MDFKGVLFDIRGISTVPEGRGAALGGLLERLKKDGLKLASKLAPPAYSA
jgi:hypothetical protein